MNNQLQVFNNQEFGNVRTISIKEKAYFVASDIAKALGYKDVTNAIKQHCRWVVKHHIPHTQSIGKTMEVNIVPEGDIYRMIANSKLPNAVKFESWVFDQVLPQIRQTGGYIPINEQDSDESIMAKALIIANKTLEKKDKIIRELQPKAENYDKFLNGSNYQTMNDVAKVIGIGRNKLFGFLRSQKILMWNNIPYQRFVENGYFVVRESVIEKGFKIINTCQTFVLPKGVEYIEKKVKEKGAYLSLSTIEI